MLQLRGQAKLIHCLDSIVFNIKKICFFILIVSLFFFDVFANSQGKVSIVIPIYNVEKYIRECLDSAINQTYKNLEIICVDDCSTDNSGKIAEEYAKKDKRVKCIRHNKNRGAGSARNTGIKNSNGEYIFFVDPDDYLELDIIGLMVEKQKETNADVIVSRARVFSQEKIPNIDAILKRKASFCDFPQRGLNKIGFDNFQENLKTVFRSSCGKLFKKDFLIKNNVLFIKQNVYGEDSCFCAKVLSNFPSVFFMRNVSFNYRVNPYSITMTMSSLKSKIGIRMAFADFFRYLDRQFEKDRAEKLKELTANSSACKKVCNPAILLTLLGWVVDVSDFFAKD